MPLQRVCPAPVSMKAAAVTAEQQKGSMGRGAGGVLAWQACEAGARAKGPARQTGGWASSAWGEQASDPSCSPVLPCPPTCFMPPVRPACLQRPHLLCSCPPNYDPPPPVPVPVADTCYPLSCFATLRREDTRFSFTDTEQLLMEQDEEEEMFVEGDAGEADGAGAAAKKGARLQLLPAACLLLGLGACWRRADCGMLAWEESLAPTCGALNAFVSTLPAIMAPPDTMCHSHLQGEERHLARPQREARRPARQQARQLRASVQRPRRKAV